jgi:hypothetical protein
MMRNKGVGAVVHDDRKCNGRVAVYSGSANGAPGARKIILEIATKEKMQEGGLKPACGRQSATTYCFDAIEGGFVHPFLPEGRPEGGRYL